MLRSSLRASLDRVRDYIWPITQAAVGAGIAWFLAHIVLGHPQPFFAPIAAVVALAAGTGGRGTQAVQMLVGVAVGVVVGELLVLVLGTGTLEVALAAATAMLAMAAASTQPLPLIQAGASAVLVIALQSPETGSERVVDALIGGGVALFISQVLLPPSPVSLSKDAGREALSSIAEGLRACARALSYNDAAAAEAALQCLREEGLGSTVHLSTARETSRKVARRTLRGWREMDRFWRLDAHLDKLDLLFGSVLLLSRASCRLLNERVGVPKQLVPAIGELARAIEALAEDPESPDARRRASDAARKAAREVAHGEDLGAPDPHATLAVEGLHLTASDVMRVIAPEEKSTEGGGLEPGA
jgi:uncharacterized membrane protein YgaE (UPF0421/DUF939 family)